MPDEALARVPKRSPSPVAGFASAAIALTAALTLGCEDAQKSAELVGDRSINGPCASITIVERVSS